MKLPGMTRRCTYCLEDCTVVKRQEWSEIDICQLDCGHQCVYAHEETTMVTGFGGKVSERLCAGCNSQFRYWGDSEYAQFCFDCRTELSIKTDADAKDVLRAIEAIPVSQWEAQMAQAVLLRGTRKPVWTKTNTKALVMEGPPPDPTKVAAAIRSQVRYGLTTEDDLSAVTASTAYVLAKNGLFEVRHTETVDIIVPHSEKPILGLVKEMRPGVKWNIPRMPYEFLRQTVALFRETCKRKGGSNEAFVRVWWNTTTKEYSIRVPIQNVTGGSVNHTDSFDHLPSGEWVVVADIHSHGSGMSAFFSGVDDADERKAPEGRLCGVIGKVTQSIPEWKWRLRTRDGFIDLRVSDCFDFKAAGIAPLPFTVTMDVVLESVADTANVRDGEVRLFCPVDPFVDATCPEEWHAHIGTHMHQGTGVTGGANHTNPHGWGLRNDQTQYVFIRDGNMLVEWEVTGSVRKQTGKKYNLVAPTAEERRLLLNGGHVH